MSGPTRRSSQSGSRCSKAIEASTAGDGNPVRHAQSIVGTRSTPEAVAGKIFAAAAAERRLLLPDRVSRLSWWVSRLAPRWFDRLMARSLGEEMTERR